MSKINFFLGIILIVVAFTSFESCKKSYAFEQKIDIPNGQWTYADTLNYPVAIVDTNKIYNFFLDIQHSTNFPTQNIYLKMHTKFPNGKRTAQIVSFDLADKSGKWLGECGAKECYIHIPIQQDAFFNQAGNYIITVEQFMRSTPLYGVKSVALILEDTQKKK